MGDGAGRQVPVRRLLGRWGLPSPSAMHLPTTELLPTAGRARSILLVEDEPSIAVTLAIDLEECGHTVTHTACGSAALALIAERSYDAVITDLRLPGADGLQIVRAVRRRHPQARVLVISAFVADHRDALLAAGAGRILQKPFLNDCVLEWLAEGRS